jgi:hypothetical protein
MRERHGRGWQPDETQTLKDAIAGGRSIADVAIALGRSERAIRIRAIKLGIVQAPEPKPGSATPRSSQIIRAELRDPPPNESVRLDRHCEVADDEDDPAPDRLRAALFGIVRTCVPEPRRSHIALQVLGLDSDGKPPTMAAVARTMGLSRERVRQLRNSAFRRIATNVVRRIDITTKLHDLLSEISAGDWRDPANAAAWVVKLATDNFAAAELFTYIFCRAGGSTVPTKDLRQQCAAAAQTACTEPDRRGSWRFDRWADARAKAIFRTITRFASPPADLIGAKRTPQKPERNRDFNSSRLGRTILCESGTEARVYRWLERSEEVQWYQEQPASVSYELEGVVRDYYPDVAVLDKDGRAVVVEVKPIYGMYRYKTLAKAVAALNHYGTRGIGYLLVDASGRTLDDIASHAFPNDVAERIETLFRDGPVRFGVVRRELTRLLGRFDFATFASMAVNRDWGVTDGPGVWVFKLRNGMSFRALRQHSGCP